MPKISDYTLISVPLDGDEWVPVVDNPSTTPVTKRVTVTNLWNQSGYYARAIKAAATLRQSNVTLTADPDLVLALLANTRYIFEMGLYIQTTTSPDWKHQLYAPAGAAIVDSVINIDAASVVRDESTVYTNTGISATILAIIKGSVINGGTAGNMGINWAQNTSAAIDTGLRAGSWFKLERATV